MISTRLIIIEEQQNAKNEKWMLYIPINLEPRPLMFPYYNIVPGVPMLLQKQANGDINTWPILKNMVISIVPCST